MHKTQAHTFSKNEAPWNAEFVLEARWYIWLVTCLEAELSCRFLMCRSAGKMVHVAGKQRIRVSAKQAAELLSVVHAHIHSHTYTHGWTHTSPVYISFKHTDTSTAKRSQLGFSFLYTPSTGWVTALWTRSQTQKTHSHNPQPHAQHTASHQQNEKETR